ncbi:MAG: polysaccharide biosynthesis tyrosine autokinase [Marmoricola sp.]|nr:polysaccharide biosynthesis tyrosine autokinase [Marmoricola sp.]
MAFDDYVQMLRIYWKSVIFATLLGFAAALGAALLVTPTYTSTAQVLFTAQSTNPNGQNIAFASTYAQGRMIAYQGLVKTPQILGPVIGTLSLDDTPVGLAKEVTAAYAPTSTLLSIDVVDKRPARATQIARAVANSLIKTVAEIETQAPSTSNPDPTTTVAGKLVTDPAEPVDPTSPNIQLDTVAGTMVGLLLGLAIAALRYLRRRSGSTREPKVKEPREPKPPRIPKPARANRPPAPKRPGKRTRRRQ